MLELFTVAFAPVNVVFTLLLLLVGLYWVTVILGVLDVNLFDIELPDSGPEVDVATDLDGAGAGPLRAVLLFFYVGEVPTMILVSILTLSLWTFSVLGNYYLNPKGSLLLAMPILLGNLIVSSLVTKTFAMPLRRLYATLSKDYNAPREVMGRICRITTTHVTKNKMGQAEVATKGAPIVLNVFSRDEHTFEKGQEAVIVGEDRDKGVYFIAPVELER